MNYTNFDIRISNGEGGGYLVRAESSSQGEADAQIVLDSNSPEVEALLKKLESRDTDREFLESFGSALYKWLFVDNIETIFQRSYGQIDTNLNQGLRVRLRITVPELAALPWELLFSSADQEFVATSIHTPIVRYLEIPSYKREFTTSLPLQVLVAIPKGSGDTQVLDSSGEKAVIELAMEGMNGKVKVSYLDDFYDDKKVTWQRILEQMSERDYHCFHFIGHGTFRNDQGYLIIDGEHGDDLIPDERFAQLFSNSASIKLVVLNACKGAKQSSSQPLVGSAAELVKNGVPAVIAMQFDIYDTAAIKFARSFYHSLFKSKDRGWVDVAITRARHLLSVDFRDQLELAAPVLFTHTDDGLLFVPETGKLIKDLPVDGYQIQTLMTAMQGTDSIAEAAKYKRRISIAKRSFQIGTVIATTLFFLSSIKILDVFTIDTQSEFLVMALGNNLAKHTLSDDLRIVTIEHQESTQLVRAKIGEVIDRLSRAGAKVVALDLFYSSENGKFKVDPDSGEVLVQNIKDASTSVVIGSIAATEEGLRVPSNLRAVVKNVGHLCYESKLGLTRSLPIRLNTSSVQLPSLALAAFAAFHEGNIVSDEQIESKQVVVAFGHRPSVQFAVSEVNEAKVSKECPLVGTDDQVSHRFIKLTPIQQLEKIATTASQMHDLSLIELANQFSGKLVLLGVRGAGDRINDLSGDREGLYWHADAINNLLLDETIVPLRDSSQLLIMLLLAGFGAALRLLTINRSSVGVVIIFGVSVLLIITVIYGYGRHGILLNPVYHILALWFAWWLSGGNRSIWFR